MTTTQIVLRQGAQYRVGDVSIGVLNVVVPADDSDAVLVARIGAAQVGRRESFVLAPGQEHTLADGTMIRLIDIVVAGDGEASAAALELRTVGD